MPNRARKMEFFDKSTSGKDQEERIYQKFNSDFKARYLSANDPNREMRDNFVADIFSTVVTRPFADDETFALSRAHGDYDVLIVGGSDPMRLSRFPRANRAITASVIKIALLHDSTPPRRARMLNSGYDEVLDSARMSLPEARARIIACAHRYEAVRKAKNTARDRHDEITFLCDPLELAPRELAVLLILARNLANNVPIDLLSRLIEPSEPAKFKRAIKVTISRIRHKLKPGYRIEATNRSGYRLFHVSGTD